jgi:hypothetical protein
VAKRVVLLIALVSASVAGLPRPADAAITWRLLTATFTIDAGYLQTFKVPCPTGMRVAGGGVSISPYHNQIQLRSTAPYDGSDSDTFPDDGWSARYRNYTDRSRTITVSVVCATGVGLVYAKRGFSFPADGVPRQGNVECPEGYHVLSGGTDIGTGLRAGRWAISWMWPGLNVITHNYDIFYGAAVGRGASERRVVAVHAVCSTHKPAVTSRDGSVGANSAISVLLNCVTAQLATGGGVRIDGPNGLQQVVNASPRHIQGDSLPDGFGTLLVNNQNQPKALTFYRICPART